MFPLRLSAVLMRQSLRSCSELDANRLNRQSAIDNRQWLYSQRRASIGSRRAAFHAGHKPNTIPTAAEIPTPMPIAQSGTYAGIGEYLYINRLASSPNANPAKPPIAVKTTASIK